MAILPYDCLETQPLERKPPGSYRFGLFALFLPSPTLSSFHALTRQFGPTRAQEVCESVYGRNNEVDQEMTGMMESSNDKELT
mmetsp:Transcript_26518/g.62905  ORF Transcript_26518/g.62905 Transcript_26518/m.62905 type:complete len:83 (-) Transcript_26518:67-315(-)